MSRGYLLDTVTVSELAKPRSPSTVRDWIAANSDEVWISVLTFGEIIVGIEQAARINIPLADRLRTFLADLESYYDKRILTFGMQDAKQWGALAQRLGNRSVDLQLAATALVHDLTVVTRNVRHFAPAGVRVVDPWVS